MPPLTIIQMYSNDLIVGGDHKPADHGMVCTRRENQVGAPSAAT